MFSLARFPLSAGKPILEIITNASYFQPGHPLEPFSPREVLARVRALIRRANWREAPTEVLALVLDEANYEARLTGKVLPVSDRTVDSHIKNLRRKFEDLDPGSDPVRSIYGVGYKYEIPVPPER